MNSRSDYCENKASGFRAIGIEKVPSRAAIRVDLGHGPNFAIGIEFIFVRSSRCRFGVGVNLRAIAAEMDSHSPEAA